MIILGIETSCDDTSVGIVQDGKKVLGELTASQINTHRQYGGVVPEVAAREHYLAIDEVIWQCLEQAQLNWSDIDRIAVTNGPGLISSLLMGVSSAKIISSYLDISVVPVNHLKAHICANNLNKSQDCELPFVCLLVSGGHTQLIYVPDYNNMQLIGQSRDDSAGEAFDKVARLLGLQYPGGPEIQKLAQQATDKHKDIIKFSRPKVGPQEFSFSGLKTAVARHIESLRQKDLLDLDNKISIAYAFEELMAEELTKKLINASLEYNCKNITIAGGVASNKRLRDKLNKYIEEYNLNLSVPDIKYCVDKVQWLPVLVITALIVQTIKSLIYIHAVRSPDWTV